MPKAVCACNVDDAGGLVPQEATPATTAKGQKSHSKWTKRFNVLHKSKQRSEGSSGCVECAMCAQEAALRQAQLQAEAAARAIPCKLPERAERQRQLSIRRQQQVMKSSSSSAVEPRYLESAYDEELVEEEEPPCECVKCKRERGEEALTVELLPMETQVTLQQVMQESMLACDIL